MLPPSEPKTSNIILHKLRPTAELPPAQELRKLSPRDASILRRRLCELVECMFDPRFDDSDAETTCMQAIPPAVLRPRRRTRSSEDLSIDLPESATGPSNWEREQKLFVRLNYCRWRVMRILQEFAGRPLTLSAARELVRWELATQECREDIVRANVPLVLAMAKRTKITSVDFSDLISEGSLALMRSVDKFDCARGFKFSTYACRAILKSFSRVAARAARYRGHFPTEFDPTLEKSDFVEKKRVGVEGDCVAELKSILDSNLANLNDIEQRVIRHRFAMDEQTGEVDTAKAKTLEQVGELIGVTKERVRQIQNKALLKLRGALEQHVLSA